MLVELFPRDHRRYSSLPLFGTVMHRFAAWLTEHGYNRARVCRHLRTTRDLDQALRSRSCRSLEEITRETLHACAPRRAKDDPNIASTVHLWHLYLEDQGSFAKPRPTLTEELLGEYAAYLQGVRGLSLITIRRHQRTASQFLAQCSYEEASAMLAKNVDRNAVEAFVRVTGQRINRASLQHEIAHLRSFLRFLAGRGQIKVGLDTEIDTPRIYRGEQLPRSVPWETVQNFMSSIDRNARTGLRDYAMFLLITTYGLRASEVVALRLDDIQWRLGRIRIPIRKTGTELVLPLTDSVAESLVAYLRSTRPGLSCREVFLRCRAPAGPLKPTAVTNAFQLWMTRSGLNMPVQGPHCLRHSYAVHLLRQGVPLKVLGDLLGHRNAESTSVYVRLSVNDLRDVALNLPDGSGRQSYKGGSL